MIMKLLLTNVGLFKKEKKKKKLVLRHRQTYSLRISELICELNIELLLLFRVYYRD